MLGLSLSETHKASQRAVRASLLDEQSQQPLRRNLIELVIHGVRYVYWADVGPPVRGIPTGPHAPVLADHLAHTGELPHVWPSARGKVRGLALAPLYPSVPDAVEPDDPLYRVLVLLDTMRVGGARERGVAAQLLQRQLGG